MVPRARRCHSQNERITWFRGLGAVIRSSESEGAQRATMTAMQPGWTTPPAAAEVFDPSPDAAAQGQFYVRRDL